MDRGVGEVPLGIYWKHLDNLKCRRTWSVSKEKNG